jgi:hypothetical protein
MHPTAMRSVATKETRGGAKTQNQKPLGWVAHACGEMIWPNGLWWLIPLSILWLRALDVASS